MAWHRVPAARSWAECVPGSKAKNNRVANARNAERCTARTGTGQPCSGAEPPAGGRRAEAQGLCSPAAQPGHVPRPAGTPGCAASSSPTPRSTPAPHTSVITYHLNYDMSVITYAVGVICAASSSPTLRSSPAAPSGAAPASGPAAARPPCPPWGAAPEWG